MAAASDYLENELLDHALGTGSWSAPANVYVALFTTAVNDDGSGSEVSAGGYARELATFAAASGGSASTSADLEFGPASASWGTVTHVAIYDASSGGNLLFHGALSASKTIGDGDEFKIATGNLTVTLA